MNAWFPYEFSQSPLKCPLLSPLTLGGSLAEPHDKAAGERTSVASVVEGGLVVLGDKLFVISSEWKFFSFLLSFAAEEA